MTSQTPIDSKFNAKSSAEQVITDIDLNGKVAIVTGGYAGVGLETTRVLSAAGASVIVPARDLGKARGAVGGLPGVELEAMDLMAPETIRSFSDRFIASGRKLHLLINNAGIMAPPLTRDPRGFESQLATNHLGHFELTLRLWRALRAADGARVVNLSSRGHARAGVDFDDPHFRRRAYDKWVAYGQSKTANALLSVALDARGKSQGIRAFAVHPGAVLTDLGRHMSEAEQSGAVELARKMAPGLKDIPQGAATSVWCATSADLDGQGGVYCEDCNIARVVPAESSDPYGVRPYAIDPELAARLWTLSEDWTGVCLQS